MIKVFIGSSTKSLPVAKGIKESLEEEGITEVRIWSEIFEPSKYTLEQILGFSKEYSHGIFIWSNDDKTKSNGRNYLSTRDNVVLETGIFYGSLGRSNVFIVMPKKTQVKVPSDLLGLGVLFYNEPADGNYRSSLTTACSHIARIINRNQYDKSIQDQFSKALIQESFYSIEEARFDILKEVKSATDLKIISNKGRTIFGTSNSIINPKENDDYKSLRKIQILTLSPESRWINRGVMALRKYESLDDLKLELNATAQIIELGFKKFISRKNLSKNSGIKYMLGEPYFRIIMTEKVVYISSYADIPDKKNMPVYKITSGDGSLYSAFRRYFHDTWKNNSNEGNMFGEKIDLKVFVGGILIQEYNDELYLALVMRSDGSWVLPKGLKHNDDNNFEIAAKREVAEELGITEDKLIIEKKLKDYSLKESPDFHQHCETVTFFLMRIVDNSLCQLISDPDHVEAKWWSLSKELPFMFYNYQKIILSEIIDHEFSIQIKFQDK